MIRGIALAAASAVVAAQQFKLVMLSQGDLADPTTPACLDGTPVGAYVSPGTGNDVNNWMLYFQGGGWCYNDYDCLGRSKTTLGSSKAWGASGSMDGLLSSDCTHNPRLCNTTKIWFPYCDGNSFSGMRDAAYNVNGTDLYFRGRRNIDRIMKALTDGEIAGLPSFTAAENVISTGCSAGGLATYMHADYMATFLPATVKSYHVLPISGFFLDAQNVDGVPVYTNQMKVIHAMANSSFGTNDACVAAEAPDTWKCNMAQYVYQYIKSPIFPLNSAYDSWQTACILTSEPVIAVNSSANGNCSSAAGWNSCAGNPEICTDAQMGPYNNFRATFQTDLTTAPTASKAGNGYFITSCHTHCEAQGGDFDVFAIGGTVMRDAVTAWLDSDGTDPAAQHSYFDCQYNATGTPRDCNPTCGASTSAAACRMWSYESF